MTDASVEEVEKRELEAAPENVVGDASEDGEMEVENSGSDELDARGEEVVEEDTEMDVADVADVVGAMPDVLFDRNAVNAQLPPHAEELSPEQPMSQVASSMGVPTRSTRKTHHLACNSEHYTRSNSAEVHSQ